MTESKTDKPVPVRRAGWNGDDHKVELAAADEVGLATHDAAVESFTRGFSAGITVEDEYDGAVVARGRTVLRDKQLIKTLLPALQYLGVERDAWQVKVDDGRFELRIAKRAAEASSPVSGAARLTLQVWIGFGLLGIAGYQLIAPWLGGLVWAVGLLLGGIQLRRGLATGRAMLSARLAMGLATIAQAEGLVLPPRDDGA